MNNKKKKPYYKTDYSIIKNMPDEVFPDLEFDECMDFATNWELRNDYCAVNRVYNKKTGKVTEVAYKSQAAAHKFLLSKQHDQHIDIFTATHPELYYFTHRTNDD